MFLPLIFIFSFIIQGQLSPLGGDYYRDSARVYVRRQASGGGFITVSPNAYWFEEVIGADVKTFTVLEQGYAKDRNHVYNGQRLDKVDVRTFESIGSGFFRDKNNVRWGGVLQLKRLTRTAKPQSFDAYSFEVLPCGFARDKTGVYAYTSGGDDLAEHNEFHKYDYRIDVLVPVDIVDAPTFEVTEKPGGCEAKDKDFIYWTTSASWVTGIMTEPHFVRIAKAHGSEGYEELGCDFVRTNRGVFWNDQLVRGADPASFQVLVKKSGQECGYGFYAKDDSHVFYQSRLIQDADPNTFQVLDTVWSYFYAFDKTNQYEQGINIKTFSDPQYQMKGFNEAYQQWKQSRQAPN